MPRNISFSLTTAQVRAKTKTVTRRMGWLSLKKGDVLNACVKCMGLKPGEKIEVICQIRVTDVRRELLRRMVKEGKYGADECRREGFPRMGPHEFVTFFCGSHGIKTDDLGNTEAKVTRIEFEYPPPPSNANVPAPIDRTWNPVRGGGALSK